MVLHTQTENVIFIYTHEQGNKIFVSISSLSGINITSFNWYFTNLEVLSRVNSQDGFLVILEFDKSEFNFRGYLQSGREYDFVSENLFDYLEGKNSSFGPTVKESEKFLAFGMMVFGTVALALVAGASILYLSKNNKVKDEEE